MAPSIGHFSYNNYLSIEGYSRGASGVSLIISLILYALAIAELS
jgi:hypothetical protein